MEFSFPISKAFDLQDGFAIINSPDLDLSKSKLDTSIQSFASSNQLKPIKEHLGEILDNLGKLSSKAQGLKHPVTTYSKFTTSQANKLYIRADQSQIYGYLRTETKRISYKDPNGKAKEAKFVCVLDFYVHESIQRTGIGRAIFNKMLKTEQLQANKLAYKRPSLELFSFLKKWYRLTDPTNQPNSYIIFSSYWGSGSARNLSPLSGRRDSLQSKETEQSKDTLEDIKEDSKINAFDLDVKQKFEREKPKQSALIDLLLKAPSVIENNIFAQLKGSPPEGGDVNLFENEAAKRLYDEVYKWQWCLQDEISQQSKYFKAKQPVKENSDEKYC